MKQVLPWAALGSLAMVAACSGGGTVVAPAQPAQPTTQSATVQFTIVVPSAHITTAGRMRPNFTAPPGTQSVTIGVSSVNGSSSTTTPTVVNLTGSNCTTTPAQTSCTASVTVPAGNDVMQVKTYAQPDAAGAMTGEGNLTLQAAAGGSYTEPTVTGGTVAKISVATFGVEGVAGTYPVVVTAYDSNGNAIIGSYASPITVADSDTTTNTSLSATTLSDSTAAAALTLTYSGASISPVTISASAPGIAAANITNASFPVSSFATANGVTTTIQSSGTSTMGYDGTPGSPQPLSGTLSNSTLTGQSLTVGASTVNNLVEQSTWGLVGDRPGASTPASVTPYYYAWTSIGSSLSYGYVGVTGSGSSELCAAPYSKLVVLPVPTSPWDALAGAGACTFTSGTDAGVFNSNGSYSDSGTNSGGAYTNASQPDGSVSVSFNGSTGSEIITAAMPSSSAQTMTAQVQVFPGAIPSPGSTATPAPVSTTAPNPWAIANVQPATPLMSDKFTPVGPITALPGQCAVPASLLGTQPSLTEVDESLVVYDLMGEWYGNYMNFAYKHYYENGVGEVCTNEVLHLWTMDGYFSDWVNGTDQNWDTEDLTKWSWLTSAGSSVAPASRVRASSQTMATASTDLSAATMADRFHQLHQVHDLLQQARMTHRSLHAILSARNY